MKKKITFSALAVSLAFTLSGVVHADTDTGKLTVTGNIVASTCTVPQNELTRTVVFNPAHLNDINALTVGGLLTAETKPLNFDVTGCPGADGSNVSIRFDYAPEASTTDYLSNSGVANGVLIGINKKGVPERLTPASLVTSAIAGGGATIETEANLYKTQTTVTAGSIASTMNVTIVNP